MLKRARIAVIGAGWWATSVHIPALLANPAAELVALCDADPGRLAAAAQAYAIEHTYTDYRALLAHERLGGMVIATSHASHYPLARDCLAAGLHVLVEKPLTLTAAHARELHDMAQAHGRELLVGYPWNYTSLACELRALLASGALGPVQFVMCVFNSNCIELLRGVDQSGQPGAYRVHGPGAVYSQPQLSGGGHGHLQLTHSIGLLSFIGGLRARRVIALMHNHGLAVDLVDALTVEFAGGALGALGGTSNAQPSNLDMQIHCAEGAVLVDMFAMRARVQRHGQPSYELGLAEGEPAYPSAAPADNLVDVVLGRAPNGSPAEPAWHTVEILDAAYRSAQAGGLPVLVDDLYEV